MSSRILEVLMVALLIMVTLNVAFQFQNQQTLQRIDDALRDQRGATADAPAPVRGRPFDEPDALSQAPAERRVQFDDDRVADNDGAAADDRRGSDEAGRDAAATREAADAVSGDGGVANVDEVADADEAEPDAPGVGALASARIPEGVTTDVATDAVVDGQPVDAGEGEADAAGEDEEVVGESAVADAEGDDDEAASAEASDGDAVAEAEAPETAEVDAAWEQHEELVVATIRRLLDGDYGWVTQRFTPQMTRRLRREDIARALDPVREEHGAFDEIARYENITHGLDEGLHAFRVFVDTASGGRLTFTITVDHNGEIDGLFMR